MTVSSVTIISPFDGFITSGLRPLATIVFAGGVGPFDILYEWDTVNTFNSGNLITDSDTSISSPHEGTPPSDMGGFGTNWFLQVTVTDNDDAGDLTSATKTISFVDPTDHTRYLYVDHNIGVSFGAGNPDGDPIDATRYLYLNHNVGVAFGPGEVDGDPKEANRFLYLNANVDTSQPCPYLESIAPSLQVQGGTVVLTGDSFGATQATYVTEIRLYETQDLLGGSFVTMAATSWSDTEVTVTVPNGASSGFVAVVHTGGTPTCDGSAFQVLNVTAVEPNPLMGWWIQTVDKQNAVTAESTILPYNVSGAGFKKIMGAIGSGFIEIPLSDPDIDSIVDPMMRKGVLIRVYLDNVFRYAFYAEKLSHVYVEEGAGIARITGRGMEVVALWTKVLPHDFPALPTQNPTWVYGSNENFVLNPGFDDAVDNPVIQNPGGEDGNDDDGNAEGWGAVGNDLDAITSIQDAQLALSDDWYIEIQASDNHSGMTQSVPVTPNRVYHVRAWVSDFIDAGMRVTLALGGADDIAAVGVTYPLNFVFDNEILAELDNVASNGLGTPGGSTDGTWQQLDVEVLTGAEQTSLTIKIQNDHHLTGVFVDFGVDDVTIEGWGLGLDPWTAADPTAHATNSFRLDDSIAFDLSIYSVEVNPLVKFAGIQQIITLNPNTKYQFSAWLHTASIVAGDTWRLVARLNDGSETFIADTADIEPGVGVWTNFAFVATMPNIEDVEIILRFAYTGPNNPGPVHMDSFAIVPGEPPSSAGTIVNDILDAMNDAGKLLFLQRTWTGNVDDVGDPDTDLDSNGKPWPSLLSLDIKPNESLLGVLERLTALGHEWEIVPINFIEGGDTGFELNLFTSRPFNSDTGIGLSQLASTSPVITPGDATMSGRIVKTAFNTNTIFAIGDDGIWSSAQQFPYETGDIPPDDPAPLGYRESFGIIEEVITVSASDTTTIGKYADARLTDEQGKESQLQLRMQRASAIRPFLDFGVGDSIFIDMPPHNPDPMDDTTGLRQHPQRIRAIGAILKGEGADVAFLVDANHVVYEDELAWLAAIAQLAERSPAEQTGQGTGTVSGTGGAVSIIGGSTGTAAHQHKLGSSEITDRTVSGDISGTLPGPLNVNKVKGMAVSNTIPTESDFDETLLVWDYDLKQWVPETFAGGSGGGSGGSPAKVEIVSFDPGNITNIPDNADPGSTWHDWPNATVFQTVEGFHGDTVLVDAVIFGTIQEPDQVLRVRITVSLDDGVTWNDGPFAWMKRAGSATDRANIAGAHSVSGRVTTNVIVKAQYWYDNAGNGDANDFHVQGFVQGGATGSTVMFDLLHSRKSAADTPDDDFERTTLDGKWTVVSGASGTVDLMLETDASIYDLTTRPGTLLMQVGRTVGDEVLLRQDYTLPDGQSIIAAVSFSYPMTASNAGGDIGNNDLELGISLSDTDSDILTGEYMVFYFELDDGSINLQATNPDGYVQHPFNTHPTQTVFMRISRVGLTYLVFYSYDGHTWTQMGFSGTNSGADGSFGGFASALDNVWLFVRCNNTFDQSKVTIPIISVDWIRQGTNDLDPWNPHAAVAVEGLGEVPADSWLANLFSRPSDETVHAYDDEFGADDIDVLWTPLTVSGTTTWTQKGHMISAESVSQTSSDGNALLKPLDALSFPLTIETAVRPSSRLINYIMFGLVFSDGEASGSNAIFTMPFQGATAGSISNSFRAGTFTNISTNFGDEAIHATGQKLYQRLIWVAANTWKYQWSLDGLAWLTMDSGTNAFTLAPTHFGLWVTTWGGTAPVLAAYDYFRVTEADLSL